VNIHDMERKASKVCLHGTQNLCKSNDKHMDFTFDWVAASMYFGYFYDFKFFIGLRVSNARYNFFIL
jgi:hypothetical protein